MEMCTKPYLAFILSHCVPLPAAGGPAMTTIGLSLTQGCRGALPCTAAPAAAFTGVAQHVVGVKAALVGIDSR